MGKKKKLSQIVWGKKKKKLSQTVWVRPQPGLRPNRSPALNRPNPVSTQDLRQGVWAVTLTLVSGQTWTLVLTGLIQSQARSSQAQSKKKKKKKTKSKKLYGKNRKKN